MPRAVKVTLVLAVLVVAGATPGFSEFWTAESGRGSLALHTDLVRTMGIAAPSARVDASGRLAIPFRLSGQLELYAPGSLFRDLAGGEIRLDSPAVLRLGRTRIPLRGLSVRRGPEERTVTVVGTDGRALFEGDHMHFKVDREGGRVRLFNVDLRLTSESASLLGEARYAGVAVAVLELDLEASIPAGSREETNGACSGPNWGAPDNDVSLIAINSVQQVAREGVFPNGRVALAPSAMLN